ncbi:hypothetical protein EV182_007009, partial [Spiromyces aspiralis]
AHYSSSAARWSHLFVDDDGVTETLDPSEFALIREQLAKYTSEIMAGTAGKNPDLSMNQQQPIGSELDEVDSEVTSITFTQWRHGQLVASTPPFASDWICNGLTTTTSYNDEAHPTPPLVCLKNDVDGLVYRISLNSQGELTMEHLETFSAFNFVVSGKREKRFAFIDPFAQFAGIVESSRRVYLYKLPPFIDGNSNLAEQNIIDLPDSRTAVSSQKQSHRLEILGVQLIGHSHLAILTGAPNSIFIYSL